MDEEDAGASTPRSAHVLASLAGDSQGRGDVCVRGARVQRGDQRTEPRRLSGVSSRPVKVGAAGTRLALERRDWTRHLAFPKERLWLRPSRQRLSADLHAYALFSSRLSLSRLPGPRGLRQRNFFF